MTRRNSTARIGTHLTSSPCREKIQVSCSSKPTEAYIPSPLSYATTKLLQILFIRELARRLKSSSPSSPYRPIFTLPTPGLCHTSFFSAVKPPESAVFHPLATVTHYASKGMLIALSRRAEVGARTIVTAACAGKEADGEFMMDGRVREVVGWVLTEEGRRVQERVFREILGAAGVQEGDLV